MQQITLEFPGKKDHKITISRWPIYIFSDGRTSAHAENTLGGNGRERNVQNLRRVRRGMRRTRSREINGYAISWQGFV